MMGVVNGRLSANVFCPHILQHSLIADLDDFDLDKKSVLYLVPDASGYEIGGIVCPDDNAVTEQEIVFLWIKNSSAVNSVIIKHDALTSAVENRFDLGGSDFTLLPKTWIQFVYDPIAQKWNKL